MSEFSEAYRLFVEQRLRRDDFAAAQGELWALIMLAREVSYRDGESNREADWACALAEAGVTGDDWSPTAIATRLAAAEGRRP